MSKVCDLTGKRPLTGNTVSHSNRRVNRRFEPNLQKKTFYIPELDKYYKLKVSTKALKTINKIGISEFIRKQNRKGIDTGIKL